MRTMIATPRMLRPAIALARSAAVLLWMLLAAIALPVLAQAPQQVPPLGARVTDTTGTLEASDRAALEARLAAIEKRHGAQVAVLIVPTTAPEAIEEYAIRVAESWKLGRGREAAQRDTGQRAAPSIDDGVLLVVAKNDRRMRIEVGYGLEGAIPDVLARRVIDERIAPRFRAGDWAGGIAAGVQALETLIAGEQLPAPRTERGGEAAGGFAALLPLIVGAFVVGQVASAVAGRFVGAGIGGVGSGVAAATTLGSGLFGIGIGLFLFLLILTAGGGARGVGRVGPHTIGPPIGWGGGWGGGGSRGGFRGGGGGFRGGGGGFGGGGASGGW